MRGFVSDVSCTFLKCFASVLACVSQVRAMPVLQIRVRPLRRHVAEVVVITNSLRSKRTDYSASRRVQDIFEIKRIHCKPIDCNTDVRSGADDCDVQSSLIAKLTSEEKLEFDGHCPICPQVEGMGTITIGSTCVCNVYGKCMAWSVRCKDKCVAVIRVFQRGAGGEGVCFS